MAGNRSGALLPDPTPASGAARAPLTAAARVAIPGVREKAAVRVTGADSAETTIAAMPDALANRMSGARDVTGRGPAVADSVVTGHAVRSGPIEPAARSGPGLRGSATAVPTGQAAAQDSGVKGHGRIGRTIVPVVHDRSRVRTVTSGSTARASAGSSGRREALLLSVIRIEGGTIAADAGTSGAVAARPSSPLVVPMSVVSVDGADPTGPTVGVMSVASAGAVDPTGRSVGAMSVVSVGAVDPTGPTVGPTGRAGTGWDRRRAAAVRDFLAVATPADPGAGAVRVGAVGPIVARRGPTSPICPMRSRPGISILRSGAIC